MNNNKIFIISIVLATTYLVTINCISIFAANTQVVDVQKIIDEYKKYLSSVKPKVRDEIVSFRRAIANLNKQKREYYQSLSPEAQHYLQTEQEFKKRLPNINNKILQNIQ